MLHEIPVTSSVVQQLVKHLGFESNWDEVNEVIQDHVEGVYGDDASPSGQVT